MSNGACPMTSLKEDRHLLEKAFEPLQAAAKDNPRALLALAAQAQRSRDLARCRALLDQVVALQPDDPEIRYRVRQLRGRAVPNWHFAMMHDDIRNKAFEEAITRAVRPDMTVLDIGSGSGLLAMMAARAGALTVHSCEMNPFTARVAEEIVSRNGFADSVTIHNKVSHELDPDADLGGRADLVISEIIGKDLVCEKVLPAMRDAVRRLAKPGAQFIPRSGAIHIALAHYGNLAKRFVDEACGFDLSPFNALHSARFSVQVQDPALVLHSESATLFDFDFTSHDAHPDRERVDLVSTGGTVNGVAQWFRLQMDAHGSFDNSPGPDSSWSWALLFFPFDEEMELAPGDSVSVTGRIVDDLLCLWRA
jgi:type III protein arginine methyltransferase